MTIVQEYLLSKGPLNYAFGAVSSLLVLKYASILLYWHIPSSRSLGTLTKGCQPLLVFSIGQVLEEIVNVVPVGVLLTSP